MSACNKTNNKTMSDFEAEKNLYLASSAAAHLQEFIDGIAASADTPCIPTGFPALDDALDGGLYEGLHIIGAISSLGKTTMVMQIADQIAQQGHDVLIFSLEMARSQLMAKTISRHTLLSTLRNGGDTRNAKTSRGITSGSRYSNYNPTEIELINHSICDYSQYADHIFIEEGIGDIGVKEIRQSITNHIEFTGNAPVCFIDYLQVLAPYNPYGSDKQNIDKAVLELKRITREYKLPLICISSLNRANYNVPVSLEAFKETGGIEYGSDVIMGLQLAGVGTNGFDVNVAKNKTPREVECIILKNRESRTGDKLSFNYYPMFNYFKEK